MVGGGAEHVRTSLLGTGYTIYATKPISDMDQVASAMLGGAVRIPQIAPVLHGLEEIDGGPLVAVSRLKCPACGMFLKKARETALARTPAPLGGGAKEAL